MAGNEIISYSFYLERTNPGTSPLFLISQYMLSAFRPVKGNQLTLPGSTKIYEVVRVEPLDNPPNQSNGYYLVDIESKDAPLRLTHMDENGL